MVFGVVIFLLATPGVTSIHAKFDVTSGPSLPQPAEARFVCDGCTLSGVDLDVTGSDYRVSLLKRKFTSGTLCRSDIL